MHGHGVTDGCSDLHSKDGLDGLRPRKTRRTGLSFDPNGSQNGQRSSSRQGFITASLPLCFNGGAEGGFVGERGGRGNTADSWAIFRHNMLARPERSGVKHRGGGGDGGEGDEAGEERYPMKLAEPSSMVTAGGPGGGQDSPCFSPSGGGSSSGGARGGISLAGGLGLITHAINTVEHVSKEYPFFVCSFWDDRSFQAGLQQKCNKVWRLRSGWICKHFWLLRSRCQSMSIYFCCSII